MRTQIDALQAFAEHRRGEATQPLVEVPEHDLRLRDAAVVDDRAQPSRLIPALEERGSEMYVIEVERVVTEGDVDALAAARLTCLP